MPVGAGFAGDQGIAFRAISWYQRANQVFPEFMVLTK